MHFLTKNILFLAVLALLSSNGFSCPLHHQKKEVCPQKPKELCPPKKFAPVYKAPKTEPEKIVTPQAPEENQSNLQSQNSTNVNVVAGKDCGWCQNLLLINNNLTNEIIQLEKDKGRLFRAYSAYRSNYRLLKKAYLKEKRRKNVPVKEAAAEEKESPNGAGFFLGLALGGGPDGLKRNNEAEDEYAIVKQRYGAIAGARVMSVSSNGFAIGTQVNTNRSFTFDFNIRLGK